MAYPIFVTLEGRRCVVVGAGRVAERRITSLLDQGADVVAVAPSATDAVEALAGAERIVWTRALYAAGCLDGAFLVFAATSDSNVNARVCEDATLRRILVSNSGRGEAGTFTTAAVVERGRLTIAMTTNGTSPTLTAVLQDMIERNFGPEWSTWTELFGRMRARIQQISSEPGRKQAVQRIILHPIVSQSIAKGDLIAAQKEAEACISLPPV